MYDSDECDDVTDLCAPGVGVDQAMSEPARHIRSRCRKFGSARGF
jgi:hypothetical protein